MTKPMSKTILICFGVLVCTSLLGTAASSSEPDAATITAREIAERHGLQYWDSVSYVAFTFAVQIPEKDVSVTRSWTWAPQSGAVRRVDTGYEYNVRALKEEDKETDALFVNDTFWLLFPFHMVWSEGTTMTVTEGPQESPISKTPLRMLTVQYSAQGGYTPGDAYDVYFDDTYRIAEWVYRKGGAKTPTRMSTWEGYQEMGGILFATEYQGPEGFRVEFRDVEIRSTE